MPHFSAAKRRLRHPRVGIARPLASQISAAKRRFHWMQWRRCRANGSATARRPYPGYAAARFVTWEGPSFALLAPCSLRPSGHRRCASFALPSASVGMTHSSAAKRRPLTNEVATPVSFTVETTMPPLKARGSAATRRGGEALQPWVKPEVDPRSGLATYAFVLLRIFPR